MPIAKERILFEDQWLLAVSKLGGELVVQGKGKLQKLPLLDFLKKEYPTIHPVHRLDFETSGVVVFAKTRNTLSTIIEKKFEGWHKKYLAIVLGVPKEKKGVITIPLPARSGEGKVDAKTMYEVKESFNDLSIVECEIERGQRHQIRKHMSMIGHPLILDQLYGNEKVNRAISKYLKMQRFFLHAISVDFPHPQTGKPIHIESPLPPVFERVIVLLKKS